MHQNFVMVTDLLLSSFNETSRKENFRPDFIHSYKAEQN